MQKFTVSREDEIYEAWPDLARLDSGRLVCVFTECKHHGDRSLARLVYKLSDDNGRSWSDKYYLTERRDGAYWFNCARIKKLADGSLVIICDYVNGEQKDDSMRNFLWFSKDGVNWSERVELPLRGIVPDFAELKSGRWLAGAHCKSRETDKLTQYLIYSDDKGKSWSQPITVAGDARFNLCDVCFLEVEPNVVVAYMRENSMMGFDCKKAISRDGGESWEGVYDVPLPGCHRPKAGFLSDGRILITYRFLQGGRFAPGYVTQNTFGAIMSADTALKTERNEQNGRIFPIDYDRSLRADCGYTGWVELPDGEIYVVDYIMDDAPTAQIRASAFRLDELILP